MGLICIIDVSALVILLAIALRRGVEEALPFAAFVFVLVPRDAAIQLPGLFDITTQRILLVALLVLYVALPKPKVSVARLDSAIKWLIFAHIGWCLLSVANSIVPIMSLKKMISEVFEYYLLYFIFFKTIRSIQTINRILLAIVAAVIVASCFGAIEAYSDWSIMQWFPAVGHAFASVVGAASGRDERISSTFAHPILFGAGLTLGIVLTLYLLKITTTTGKKVLLWSGLLLMFLNIYKTSSRGPWLGLVISLCVLFLWDNGRLRKYLSAVAIVAVAVLIIRPGVWDTIANIYGATFDPESPLGSSYEYRYVLRDLAVKAVSKDIGRSLWGYGMESFYHLHLKGELYGRPYNFVSCDSAWLELLVETGYVGLLTVGLILVLPLCYAWKELRQGPGRIQLYFMSAMLSYYFMMLSVAMYGWGQTGYMLWMIIASSLACRSLRTRVPVARFKFGEIGEQTALSQTLPSVNYSS